MNNHLELLNRLEGVRQTGEGRWIAKCPAHDDRSPSLTLRDAGDLLLVTCHAGCDFYDVIGAAGMAPSKLFSNPKSASRSLYVDTVEIPPADVMLLLEKDLIVLAIGNNTLMSGGTLCDAGRESMLAAQRRVFAIMGSVAP